jgi:hypothetical protein
VTTKWNDVPDPRDEDRPCSGVCQVFAEERAWRHIVEEHLSDRREPWDEWLTPALAARFRNAWQRGSTDEGRAATLEEVSVIVEREAKTCLGVPLALLYDSYQPPPPGGRSPAQETWNLVLPAGALLVARSHHEGGELRTCYFKGSACRATDARQRWRALVRELVLCYAERRADGMLVPPQPGRLFAEGEDTRSRVRFRTAASWYLDGCHAEPWQVMPNPWPLPPPAPVHRLGPRHPY